jgi:hypothetical protein
VAASAPRLDARLVAALEHLLKDDTASVAELNRRLGAIAETLSLTRPSYERVRQIVRDRRRGRLALPTAGEVLLGVASRGRHPEDLLSLLADPTALSRK